MKKRFSAGQQLKILKTKAWVWTCARELAENPFIPLKAYSLTAAANDFNKKEKPYDNAGFYKYMKGQQAANEKTVNELWSAYRNVYSIGPLVSCPNQIYRTENSLIFNVPLWSAISGDNKQLVIDWKKIPPPYLTTLFCDDFDYLRPEALEITYKGINNIIDLNEALKIILSSDLYISPMIIFTAYLSKLRIHEEAECPIYDDLTFITKSEEIDFFIHLTKLFYFLGIDYVEIENILYDHSLPISGKLEEQCWYDPDEFIL